MFIYTRELFLMGYVIVVGKERTFKVISIYWKLITHPGQFSLLFLCSQAGDSKVSGKNGPVFHRVSLEGRRKKHSLFVCMMFFFFFTREAIQ